MKILVAGATGFLGQHVVVAARDRGHDVVGTGRDIGAAATGSIDAVVWAAGRRDLSGNEARAAHVEAPARLLRTSRVARFVYLSSAEVYGLEPPPYREREETAPATAYGELKLAGEHALRGVAAATGAALCCLRITVAYGPGQVGSMLLPSLLAALRARSVFETSNGSRTRDYVHVRDVARAVVAAVEQPDAAILNIGSGREVPVATIVGRVVRLCSAAAGEDLRGLVRIGARPERPHDPPRYVVDAAAARRSLGWAAEIPLSRGLSELARDWAATGGD